MLLRKSDHIAVIKIVNCKELRLLILEISEILKGVPSDEGINEGKHVCLYLIIFKH